MTNKTLIIALALLVVGLSIAPAAVAKPGGPGGPGGPNCYDWYWEIDLGPVEVVSRNSCSYAVEESDDGEGPL